MTDNQTTTSILSSAPDHIASQYHCARCERWLPVSAYHRDSSSHQRGVSYHCKECRVPSPTRSVNEPSCSKCSKCLQVLPLTRFAVSRYGRYGHQYACKSCMVAYQARHKCGVRERLRLLQQFYDQNAPAVQQQQEQLWRTAVQSA